jgi:tetratricopeptide (TPR) repeat protein
MPVAARLKGMTRSLPLVLALAATAGAEPDLASRIEEAQDLATLQALRAEVEEIASARPHAPETVALLRKLASVYWLHSDGHEDEELIQRIAAIPGTELDAGECNTLGRKYLRERRYEDARGWLARALALPAIREEDQRMLLAEVREGMGDALEGLGRWEEALGYHESWRPQGFCGNCNASEEARRLTAVARCKYRVGLARQALDALWEQSRKQSDLLGAERDPAAFAHYAEFSVREGKVEKLREQYGTLPEEHQRVYAWILAVAEAFAAKDAPALVRTVCGNPGEFCDYGVVECCGRMLDDCGPGAAAALSEAVKSGAWEAAELAGHTQMKELLPALRARLEDKPDPKSAEWLRWAVVRLEALP